MATRLLDHVKMSVWYIDLSASHHSTHDRDWFVDYRPLSNLVILGGGEEHTVVDKGNI